MIKLRRKGFRVTYVTDADQFVESLLGSPQDFVLVVDIHENSLTSQMLADRTTGNNLILRIYTDGEQSSNIKNIHKFIPDIGVSNPESSTESSSLNQASTGLIPIGCLVEFFECRGACLFCTDPLTTPRRLCDQCCNGCSVLCANGQPCFQVNCCPDNGDE